jgi:amino acid transporter
MASVWLDQAGIPAALTTGPDLPQTVSYRVKRRLLGPPLTRDALKHERLSKRLALGVLSSDCISSSAYGTEEMLLVLLPTFGLTAFTILLPLTGVILAVLFIVTMSYRDVVRVYTKAGGSYVVAREMFGPTVAQVAAVALMLDYIVTVAVQASAGTLAVTSAIPALAHLQVQITVAVVLLLFFGNVRGLREAGRTFAFPTYFFVASLGVVILTGLVREIAGDLPQYATNLPGQFPVGGGSGLLSLGALYILAKAFANGGSSLTGLEAVSNGVSAFKPPEGRNARRTLSIMSLILGSLVLGVSWLAHQTHAMPYVSGTPTVISQVAQAVFGTGPVGHGLYLLVQLATVLILWTGANTPFNGFPFLASFVAEDQFLPKQLTRRGHRLAFSNGIIVLCIAALALTIATGAQVNSLVAFYAIGVFTGFTFAGFGMAKYFRQQRTGSWRAKVVMNSLSGAVSLAVVLIFAVVKFTEGAWLVLIIFPVGVFALIRLNRQYRSEAAALSAVSEVSPASVRESSRSARHSRHETIVLVDSVDLATIGAVRYATNKRAQDLKAVHFVLDEAHAEQLQTAWCAQPALREVPLHLVDCPDRRLARAALELASRATEDPGTDVTILLPRRTYSPILGRLLHDRTADEIARATSRLPRVVATIIPFDVDGIVSSSVGTADDPVAVVQPSSSSNGHHAAGPAQANQPVPPDEHGCTPIGSLVWRQRATVEGIVRQVRVAPLSGAPSLQVEVWDATGGVTVVFYGRRRITGIDPGRTIRVDGMVGELHGCLAISNPTYQLVETVS